MSTSMEPRGDAAATTKTTASVASAFDDAATALRVHADMHLLRRTIKRQLRETAIERWLDRMEREQPDVGTTHS